MNISIQSPTPDTLQTWLALRKKLWHLCPEEKHLREIQEYLHSNKKQAFIAYSDDNIPVGFIEVSLRDYAEGCTQSPVAYIEGWFVDEAFRRKGIGTLLMQTAEGWAHDHGCTQLASDAELDNATSIDAHKRMGFKTYNKLVHFIKDIPKE
jgi:aminoglycoside 6'-N-acetyltransferase I